MWAILTFDPAVSREQRDALVGILHRLHWYRPATWTSYAVGEDAAVAWARTAKGVRATLGGGTLAETATETVVGLQGKPVVMNNMPYFGYPRNSGFTLMPTTRLSLRHDGEDLEFKGTNGLLTTVDLSAADFRE